MNTTLTPLTRLNEEQFGFPNECAAVTYNSISQFKHRDCLAIHSIDDTVVSMAQNNAHKAVVICVIL